MASDSADNESGTTINVSKMYGDQDTSWLPDGATWYQHTSTSGSTFDESRTSNSSMNFGLDSDGLTFNSTSSATDKGSGEMKSESKGHSILLDGSDKTEVFSISNSYTYDLESTDGAAPTGSITETNESKYEGYDNAPPDSISTVTTTYAAEEETDDGSDDAATDSDETAADESAGEGDDGTVVAYGPTEDDGIGGGGVPEGSHVDSITGHVYDADGNLVGMLNEDGNLYWPADWGLNGPVQETESASLLWPCFPSPDGSGRCHV